MNRRQLGAIIESRLRDASDDATKAYARSSPTIGFFVVDDILPAEIAHRIHAAFPEPEQMRLLNTIRERKLVSAQMDRHDPILEEAIYAFQEPGVVDLVRTITDAAKCQSDEHLYAGGISMMTRGHFLNPHLDNSHDRDRGLWRVLNLLYYVSPDWGCTQGGNLELWPRGTAGKPVTIESRFNRLVVMATHGKSWHSVSPVRSARARCCVSNYYFSDAPLRESDAFHVTSYRGRPGQPFKDIALRTDAALRGAVRWAFPAGIRPNPHFYRR